MSKHLSFLLTWAVCIVICTAIGWLIGALLGNPGIGAAGGTIIGALAPWMGPEKDSK